MTSLLDISSDFPTRQLTPLECERLVVKQRALLVVGEPKAIAIESGLCLDTVYRARNGVQVSILTGFRISAAQQNFDYLALLASKCGYLLTAMTHFPPERRVQDIEAQLLDRLGIILRFCGKMRGEDRMEQEELQALLQATADVRGLLDRLDEQATEYVEEQEDVP